MPIFCYTYADPKGDLQQLKRERKAHLNLLIPRFLKSDFSFLQFTDFTQDDLKFGFEEYIDKITIFHFSGHAGMGEIKLQDGSTFIEGIARQMKKVLGKNPLPQLVLVFLNGCSTGTMVDDLLQAGVPVVIGTSASVADSIATDFSINFYEALMEDYPISQAFEKAEDALKTINNSITITRGIGRPTVDNKPLWGIFANENKKNLLEWKLSDLVSSTPADSNSYEINTIIQGALYNSLLKAGLQRIKDLEEDRLNGEDIREQINAAVLLGYPGPISYKIAKLLNVEIDNDGISERELLQIHLNNIYNVHQSLSELLFLIMLSQLWEICLKGTNDKPMLPVDFRKISAELEIIKEFFTTTRKQRRFFNYVPKIQAIRKIFDEASKKYFVDELEQLKIAIETDEDFIACYQYFNTLRSILENQDYTRFNNDDWVKNCEKGEKYLADFFNTISFCTKYDFGILKNIELLLPRFLNKPSYTYRLLKFPKNGNTKYFTANPVMMNFTSVKSIVMLKTENFETGAKAQDLEGQINLFPFMLDYNVNDPTAEKGNLLIYSNYNKDTGNYLYEEAFRSDAEKYIKSGEPVYEEVHATFNAFLEVLFNEKIDILNQ